MSNIVLIHGQWMTPLSWKGWKERFESRGHSVLAPGWPGVDDRGVEAIRRDPSTLEGLGIKEIADYYESIIRGLEAPPIIIGHSFGDWSRRSCLIAVSAPPEVLRPRDPATKQSAAGREYAEVGAVDGAGAGPKLGDAARNVGPVDMGGVDRKVRGAPPRGKR